MSPSQIRRLALKLVIKLNLYTSIGIPPVIYLLGLITGLTGAQAFTIAAFVVPFLILVTGVGWPYLSAMSALKRAFSPGYSEQERLTWLLKAPQIIAMHLMLSATLGGGTFATVAALAYNKSLWAIPWSAGVILLILMLLCIQLRVMFERELRPYAIREFHKKPDVALKGSGIFWTRQRTFLPYAFGVFVANTLMMTVSVIGKKVYDSYGDLLHRHDQVQGAQFSVLLKDSVGSLASELALPLALVGIYLLINAALVAWQLARQQSEAAKAVQQAMESLAAGTPQLPAWVSTDELGDLAVATARVFDRLKAFSLSLGESAQALRRSAEQLGQSASKHTEVLTLQATALQETQVTAQEIKQTSILASQKAENVLQQTERADAISTSGENALQSSLNGLQEIGDQVKEMSKRIKALDDRTRQIANITTTVKDLADQSNMLALNAAIEAVRSGEHGKGFGVVAREIRALADQSIQATNNVREILQDISDAIRTTVSMTDKGSEKVEASLVQIREFGDNIRQLSGIVRDNASSVRQITAAVTQQNAGIGQIFQAVNDLSKLMDQTMVQVRASDEALKLVRNVAEKVSTFLGDYSWEQAEGSPKASA